MINKKTAWSTYNDIWLKDSDCAKLKMISELLCIKHRYANLYWLSSDDAAVMTEALCTAYCTIQIFHCVSQYAFHAKQKNK